MAYENNEKKMDSVYSARIRAGKRRTYFFDVRATRGNDYYLTITESRKRFNEDGYDRHKIFLYKEDFNKFIKGLTESIDYVKTDLMPDFDFDAFNHDAPQDMEGGDAAMHESGEEEQDQPPNTSAKSNEAEPMRSEPEQSQEPKASNDISTKETTTSIPNHNDEEVDKW